MASLIEIRKERLGKIEELRKLGIYPYPSVSGRTHKVGPIISNFADFEGKEVSIAGRLMSFREHGTICFSDLEDESGKIQLYLKVESISPFEQGKQHIGYDNLKLLDIGDIVQVSGIVVKTKTGQVSVEVKYLHLLTKSLRPLPDKHDGLRDPELIFRQRYLDLAINRERRELFRRKSVFWQANRMFMKEKGFLEVETPVLEQVTGGADAKPFTTHHNALDQDFFLRISTELYLKRLIGGGFEKIYTLGPNFRNEGIDDEHLQEYYQIEWYEAYADYRSNMEMVREMFRFLAKTVYNKTEFTRGEHTFDLATDWQEIDYTECIKKETGIDIWTMSEEAMCDMLKERDVILGGKINKARLVDNLWKLVRKNIAGPAFLINEPKFMSPLAKSKNDNPDITERFHVILAGSELGNGYSELNDPVDQLERFREQQKAREEGDEEAQMLDIDYVEMLEYGMPPVSGYAHSERLFWFFENLGAREATLFPQMRHKLSALQREIYGLE
ncbi:MAG TPA: lysine--tRNA ligase [Candidatus Paceibacterota bacterium]